MSFNLFSYTRKIHRPLLLDGAMGSLLQQKGVKSLGTLWTSLANAKHPKLVMDIHKSYLKAGADIITTNTFRTNPSAVSKQTKYDFKKLVKASVQLAKEATKNYNVLIAGSNAPAEDCYQIKRTISKRELEYNHKRHIDELMLNGCDFILNETQSHFDEIKIICDFCYKNNIPFIMSFFVKSEFTLLSGEKISEVIKFVLDKNPLCVGFNCITQNVFEKIFQKLNLSFNWGVYLNLGSSNYQSKKIITSIFPNEYAAIVLKYLRKQPSIIGGCCGSNPSHIKKLREVLDGKFSN